MKRLQSLSEVHSCGDEELRAQAGCLRVHAHSTMRAHLARSFHLPGDLFHYRLKSLLL